MGCMPPMVPTQKWKGFGPREALRQSSQGQGVCESTDEGRPRSGCGFHLLPFLPTSSWARTGPAALSMLFHAASGVWREQTLALPVFFPLPPLLNTCAPVFKGGCRFGILGRGDKCEHIPIWVLITPSRAGASGGLGHLSPMI